MALLGVAIAMLLATGADDWPASYGALVSMVRGLTMRRAPLERRVEAVTLALPALIAAALLVWFVVAVVPTIAD